MIKLEVLWRPVLFILKHEKRLRVQSHAERLQLRSPTKSVTISKKPRKSGYDCEEGGNGAGSLPPILFQASGIKFTAVAT